MTTNNTTNLVLYRKYRPQTFGDVVGQQHVVQTLINSISSGNTSHAYLFCGPRGSGKTSIARIFAKAINCQNSKNGEPCNKCDNCQEIMAAKSIDLIEIDAASHTGVDDIRELTEGIKFAPVKSKYKVFIIDECHQLSKSAANALLKTLEEPPAHAIFLLATTEAHKMISTITSRCQRFDFKKLQIPEIVEKLERISKKEGIKFDNSALSLIALNSRGSFRDAESILDKCISFAGQGGVLKTESIKDLLGIVEVGQVSQFVDNLIAKDTKTAVFALNSLIEGGIDLQEFAKTLVFYMRQSLMLKINPEFLTMQNSGFSEPELEKIKTQTAQLSQKQIQDILEYFIEAENKMKYAAINQLPLELAILNITYQEA